MTDTARLQALAGEHGTPLLVIDHARIREQYRRFTSLLPRVQAYYAVKANSEPAIVRTLFELGASFDVASFPEFLTVYRNIEDRPEEERQAFIWDKVIYANTIKQEQTLRDLNPYKPLVTFDNPCELGKIRRHCPNAGLVLRLQVSNTGSMVELSSKFGADPADAMGLIEAAHAGGLVVEGLSFHVGSQCNNFDNYIQALETAAAVFKEAAAHGRRLGILDIGGGFPVPYHSEVRPFEDLARILNEEIDRLFPADVEIAAEPGRFMVATAGTAVSRVIGKAVRDGKPCYYLDDGVYHTYSGVVFDHCHYPVHAFRDGPRRISAVFGPTCDAFDTISVAEDLPELEIGDLVYAENIGAYSNASATHFNGFPPARIVHI
jgi:ornithine decarboxylase